MNFLTRNFIGWLNFEQLNLVHLIEGQYASLSVKLLLVHAA